MRAVDNVFHLKCFICVVCGVRLQKGDQYVIKQSQLFCRPDYEKEVEMFQGYNYGEKMRNTTRGISLRFHQKHYLCLVQTIIAVKMFITQESTVVGARKDRGKTR